MRTVLLPLGAVEKHGPHLPLDTDTVMAAALAARVAKRLGAEVATPFTQTAASFAADFPGTVSTDPAVEQRALAAAIRSLLSAGAERVALVNLHFDPEHLRAVRGAVAEEPRIVFPDFTRRASAQRIGGEFATGACHAGEFETSLMLAVAPGSVGDFRALPPREVNLALAIKQGKRSFRELGLDEAYCGHPATATAKEGERLLEVLTRIVTEAVAP